MAHVFRSLRKDGTVHTRWRFQYTDWHGNRRTATGYASKTETQKLAVRVQAHHDEIRRGYREPPKASEQHIRRPFAEVVEEFIKWGTTQGGHGGKPWGPEHARKHKAILPWWREHLGLETLRDLSGILPRVEKVLRELHAKGLAGKTVQAYAATLKTFVNWCNTRGYINDEPLKALVSFDITPQTKRRALTTAEITRLIRGAPEHRGLLYEVAFCSGLRAGELRALTIEDLDTERCGLVLHSEWTKNRQPGFQPLPRRAS